MTSTLLFYSNSDDPEPWRQAIGKAGLDFDFRVWPDAGKLAGVRYTLVWKPPRGWHQQFPNLRAILSLGAGVDGIMSDPDLPQGVPVVRLVDAGLGWQMAEYACYGALHFYRRMHEYAELQTKRQWRPLTPVSKSDFTVGVMGLGVLGVQAIRMLLSLGFEVIGWSRSEKTIDGVRCYSGDDERDGFLAKTRVLINFLPLTPLTDGIINATLLAQLPRGAFLVNVARGRHVNEADLLKALDNGHIAGAMLDVFVEEPLRQDHPFWNHPRVVVTPHVAGVTLAEEAAQQVICNLRRLERGEAPLNVVDRSRGY